MQARGSARSVSGTDPVPPIQAHPHRRVRRDKAVRVIGYASDAVPLLNERSTQRGEALLGLEDQRGWIAQRRNCAGPCSCEGRHPDPEREIS